MSTHQAASDVIIVGGGLVGLSAAYHCAKAGAMVTCLEQDQLGGHQSLQNWGFARQQGRGPVELPMMKLANGMWRSLADELDADVGWVEGGNLAVYTTEEDETNYRRWLAHGEAQGIASSFVTPEAIRDLIPQWQRAVRGGLYAATDGHANPDKVVQAYISACRRAGVRLMSQTPATGLVVHGDRITGVQTTKELLTANHVVVAAGAWSRKLLSSVNLALPQNYVIGTVSLTSPVPPITTATVWGPGFSFRQRTDGRFVCALGGGGVVKLGIDTLAQTKKFLGAFRKNHKRFAVRPGPQIPAELKALARGGRACDAGPPRAAVDHRQPPLALSRLQQTLSGLGSTSIESSWAGVIDSTPDALPVVDGNVGIEGLVVATGFSGHGYGLVPALGPTIAALVEKTEPACDLTPMRFRRFADGDYTAPDAIL